MFTLWLALPLWIAPPWAPLDRGPIDFATIPRTIEKTPAFVAAQPLYGLFLFGPRGETRVWAVIDAGKPDAPDDDVLYIDLDADGDLTDANERIASSVDGERVEFKLAEWLVPGSQVPHRDFVLRASDSRTSYSMLWRGEKKTMGGYGPTGEDYARFAASPKEAPIFVPGYDLPFQFETWGGEELSRSSQNDFKVFVGNRGSARGTFSCVDDKFLPASEYVVVTLRYVDAAGERQEARSELRQRC